MIKIERLRFRYIWSMMTRSIHECWHVRTNKCVRTNLCNKPVFVVCVRRINIRGRILTKFTGLLRTNTVAAKRDLLAERTCLGKSVSVGGIWANFLNAGGGSSTPEMDVPSSTAGSKVLELSQKHYTSKRCVFTEFQASTLASTPTTFTSERCRRRRKRRRNLDDEFDIRGRVCYCWPLHDSNTVPKT